MLKKIFNLVIFIISVLAIHAVYKSVRIPVNFTMSVTKEIKASPSKVFLRALTYNSQWDLWHPWKKNDPTFRLQFDGPASGQGSMIFWNSKRRGQGEVTWKSSEPPFKNSWSVNVSDFGGKWIFDFEIVPDDVDENLVKLIWTISGKRVPMEKPFWYFFDLEGMLRRDMAAGLENIKVLTESDGH